MDDETACRGPQITHVPDGVNGQIVAGRAATVRPPERGASDESRPIPYAPGGRVLQDSRCPAARPAAPRACLDNLNEINALCPTGNPVRVSASISAALKLTTIFGYLDTSTLE
ncbi:MAG: hypothetical protein OXI64_07735, partial [Defluviicoccus sp.]|nr:hypothetical protein [Defluviicoccus sp.]